MRTLITILIQFCSLTALAGRVVKMSDDNTLAAVAYKSERFWRLNDTVCIDTDLKTFCGPIILMTEGTAVVQFSEPVAVNAGTGAYIQRKQTDFTVVSYNVPESIEYDRFQKFYGRDGRDWDLTLGTGVLLDYETTPHFPISLGIEYRVDENVSLGVIGRFTQLGYSDKAGPVLKSSLYGGGLMLNYYANRGFSGLWTKLEVALYKADSTYNKKSDSQTGASLSGLIGYRYLVQGDINLGFGVLINYSLLSRSDALRMSYSIISPGVHFDVGVAF